MRLGGRCAIAAGLLALAVLQPAFAKPRPGHPRHRDLFASAFAVLNVNRVYCGINNIGEVCRDPSGSGALEGGFWPKGTPDSYIFSSGIQLAGVIPAAAGFPWAGDTVAAYFIGGDRPESDPVTAVFNSIDAADELNWPHHAVVWDTTVFNSLLIGRKSVSQQDLWVRIWDGNPNRTILGEHPAGILVEERGMGWNYPTGNEDIIYFVYTFYNVTAKSPGVYSTLDPSIRDEVARIGADFQARNEAHFGVDIPDGGYAVTSLFAAFFADMDVANSGSNYATPVIPFAMGVTYNSAFLEPSWIYPLEIFAPPFVPAPGFVGVKYLRSPLDSTGRPVGLTMFSNTTLPFSAYPDPTGGQQLYRYLSGTSSPAAGDSPCTFQGQQRSLHFCFLSPNPDDVRFFQSSGPMTLFPGQAQSIVVAYIFAAPTDAVLPFVGGDFPPEFPATGDSIAANPTRVRPIERAMGWVGETDADSNFTITQDEVQTVPRSLLNKALVAQAVFDNRFLLPFSPTPPAFFLVPGDNQVTIAWQRSASETVQPGGGDPFFTVTSDPTSPLYDPNFRQYDVEGYRIYRGRTTGDLRLVAQFDYAGTSMVDFTGQFDYPEDRDGDGRSECAPEIGVLDDCPIVFPSATGVAHPLVGRVVQVPTRGRRGRVQLANGSMLVLQADTAVSGGGQGYPELSDNSVTFTYVDRSVRNSFHYFYAVTAFDVNSFVSGPTSIESPRVTKSVAPRVPAANATTAALVQGVYGADGMLLDPTQPYPQVDSARGTFSGNMPPSNGAALVLASAVLEALPAGDISVRIDSVGPGFGGGIGTAPNLYLTLSGTGTTVQKIVPLTMPGITETGNTHYTFDESLLRYDSSNARRFEIAFTQDVRMPITFGGDVAPLVRSSPGIHLTAGRFAVGTEQSRYLAHSRWFDAAGPESQADPTVTAFADSFHHAGHLSGVGRIWSPGAYRDRWPQGGNADAAARLPAINPNLRGFAYAATAWYPADFLLTWNADSSITVFDSSNHSPLPFAANGGSGWGFLNLNALAAAGVSAGDLADGTGTTSTTAVTYHALYATRPTCTPEWWSINCAPLEQKAQLEPIDFNYDGVVDGNGIVLLVNTEPFFMELSQLPATGTRWRLRAIGGAMSITGCTITGTPPATVSDPLVGPEMSDCTGYTHSGAALRPAFVPGLTYKVTVVRKYAVDDNAAGDLSRVHTVPDPYYVTNALEASTGTKILKFVHLPSRAIIRIYSTSGVLVQVLTHNDASGGGEETWNLRSRNNQFVASGVYFFHVEAADGRSRVGRFTVVNYAP